MIFLAEAHYYNLRARSGWVFLLPPLLPPLCGWRLGDGRVPAVAHGTAGEGRGLPLSHTSCSVFSPPFSPPLHSRFRPSWSVHKKTLLLSTTSAILVDIHFGFSVTDEFWCTLESKLNLALWRASVHSCSGPLLRFAVHLVYHVFASGTAFVHVLLAAFF